MESLTIHKDEAARLADRIQDQLHDIERTIALALTVLGAAFAVGPARTGQGLTTGQKWFVVLLPGVVFSLVMLGVNRMTALIAMGGVRRWHEKQVNDAMAGDGVVLPWEERVAILERYDPAGYVIFTIMPLITLLGTMVASFVVATGERLAFGLIMLPFFLAMAGAIALAFRYMMESGDVAYRLANGEAVHLRRLPFMAPIRAEHSRQGS